MPPGSETAKARERAEAQRSQDVKGKGSGKGTSKEGGKDPPRIPGKLPPTFVAMLRVKRIHSCRLKREKKRLSIRHTRRGHGTCF